MIISSNIQCVFLAIFLCLSSCTCNNYGRDDIEYSDHSNYNGDKGEDSSYSDDSGGEIENNSGCRFDDGTYTASVDYYNSETGYSESYTLDIEVKECQVVLIYFPNGGYLDGDHITYADINEDGYAYVEGEGGKSYEIYID
jgi:hypothetical protein